ncbi:MAG: DUF1187 family protein [Candidatus Phlomobacter fragariae]
MKYLIKATIVKNGGAPVCWQRYSDRKLSKQDCLKMLSETSIFRMQFGEINYHWTVDSVSVGKRDKLPQVSIENFTCHPLNPTQIK